MGNFKSGLLNAITKNNSWILIIVLTLVSFNWVMTFQEHGKLIYLHSAKWNLFLKLLGGFLVIFSPLILVSLFRKPIKTNFSFLTYWIIWVLIFVIYPIIIGFTQLSEILSVNIQNEMLTLIGFALAGVDLISNPDSGLNLKSNLSKWVSKISVEWIVVGLFIILPLQHGTKLEDMNGLEASFWATTFSVLLTYSFYYLFYYINHYFLVNKVYKDKGLVYYIFSFLGLMVIFFTPLVLMYYYLPGISKMVRLKLGEEWIGENPPAYFSYLYLGTITSMMYLTIPLTIIVQWFKQSQAITNLKKEKSETELNLLKQQINPHFFFNTLNNVYSMSLKNDGRTSEAVLQLSDLMRYVIYKGKEDKVSLAEEVAYIKDFIELQRMRLLDDSTINFSTEIENPDLQISPLLFIILVENGFKHGLEKSEEEGQLTISISEKSGKIQLLCMNSYDKDVENQNGVGLENLKKRLTLLYPNQHSLEITKENGIFTAIMTLHTDAV